MAIAFGLSTQVNAQTDTASKMTTTTTTTQVTKGSTKYFYYPQANVYYNETNGNYSYMDPTTNTWTTNQKLPSTIVIDKTATKTPITFDGTEVWTDNATHQKKYGGKAMAPKP